MKKPLQIRSIAFVLPATLLALIIIVEVSLFFLQSAYERTEIFEDVRDELGYHSARLARLADHESALHSHFTSLIQEELVFDTVEGGGRIGVITDKNGTIVIANDNRFVGQNIYSAIPDLKRNRVALALSQLGPHFQRSEDGKLLDVVHPFKYYQGAQNRFSGDVGFIYMQSDLESRYVAGERRIFSFQIWYVIGLSLITGMLYFWLNNRVSKPIRAIALAGRELLNNEQTFVESHGVTEVRELAHVLNSSAHTLSERRRALEAARHQLNERMKELSCIYDVFKITEQSELNTHEILTRVVARLPASMQFPDRCEAGIDLNGEHFGAAYRDDSLSAGFTFDDGKLGRVFVQYRHGDLEDEENPYLPEESEMLQTISSRLEETLRRVAVQHQLNDNLNLLRAIFDSAPDAIELADAQTQRIIDANEASCQMLGYSREERLHQRVPDFQAEMSEAQLEQIIDQIHEHGGAKFDTKHIRKDGSLIDARVHVRPLHFNKRDYLLAIWQDITAEIKAGQDLQKLSLVVEQSPDTVVITDLDSNIVYVNPAFVDITGYSLEEAIGQNPRILQSGQTPKKTYDEMWETILRGDIWQGEFINRSKDGRIYIEDATIIPLKQDNGSITHYVAIKEDVTERKAMLKELEQHRETLELEVQQRTVQLSELADSLRVLNSEQSALFEAASVGICYIRDRKILRLNTTMANQFASDVATMTGQTTESWYPDEATFNEVGSLVNEGLTRCGEFQLTRELIRKDGSTFWANMSARAIDQNDPSKGIVGVLVDITEEIAINEAMKTANAEQRAILDAAGSGIALLQDRHVKICNKSLHDMLGWPEGALIGKHTRVWYTSDHESETVNGVYEAIWRGETHSREQQLQRRDGSVFWARLTGSAVDTNDHSKGTVWIIDDITDQRNLIAQMAEAQRLAEEAARTKSEFLANMSHEIRTPMNAILGMSHLMLKTPLSPRQHEYVDAIQSAGSHLLAVINDILDVSKIESGKLELEHTPFNLDSMISNVISLNRDQAVEKGLEIILNLEPGLPQQFIGDPLRLGQILINYLSNAIKFTEAGHITISVSIEGKSLGEAMIKFSVQDTGVGIAEENVRKLFENFQQEDTATTRRYGGTGLGLAISKQLAGIMGGDV